MSNLPTIHVLLTTYKRTSCAVKTVQGIKKNLRYPNIAWYITDDGSPPEHVSSVIREIGGSYQIRLYDSARRGVGHGMNHALADIFKLSPLVLVMEDDWELTHEVDFTPYARLLMEDLSVGMIRFGYLSVNLLGTTVAAQNQLFWRLESNNETYRFTGHPSLRHQRFHQIYGFYEEGKSPGETELSMCHKANQQQDIGPKIYIPTNCGSMGYFGHIGAESLADVRPG